MGIVEASMATDEKGKKHQNKRDMNIARNNAHIYITQKQNANKIITNWKKYKEWHWSKYQIKETDMRIKTASFTTPNPLDLTSGVYAIMITSPMHEDFGGIIIKEDYDYGTGLYTYECQDYSRFYQSKFDLVYDGSTSIYRILQYLLTRGGIPVKGKITKKMKKKYKDELSGLRPLWQYEQGGKKTGSMFKNFNPFKVPGLSMIIRNKSYIEAIRDLVFSTGMPIDVYFNKYGVLQIEPFIQDEWQNKGLHLISPEITSAKFTFDTTNIITGVNFHSSDKLQEGKYYSSQSLVDLDLSVFFGDLRTSMDNPVQKSNSSSKQSSSTINMDNPYGTKRKAVEVSFDNYTNSRSKDRQLLNEICTGLEKNGWKILQKIQNSNGHTESYMKHKDCVHLMVVNGMDADMIKEETHNTSFRKIMKRMNCRPVLACIGCRNPPSRKNDFRKGGNAESHLAEAHDGKGYAKGGIDNPREWMIKGKIPFLYGANTKEIVDKFLKGGDEPEAL